MFLSVIISCLIFVADIKGGRDWQKAKQGQPATELNPDDCFEEKCVTYTYSHTFYVKEND